MEHTPDMPSENLVTSLPGYHPWQPVSHNALKLTQSYMYTGIYYDLRRVNASLSYDAYLVNAS